MNPLTYAKLAGSAILIAWLWYLIHEYQSGQQAKIQLKAELECADGSACFTRIMQQSAAAAQVVEQTKREYDEQAKRDQQQHERESEITLAAERQAAVEREHKLSSQLLKINTDIATNKTCQAQANTVIACAF